jgi:hypothetical protein
VEPRPPCSLRGCNPGAAGGTHLAFAALYWLRRAVKQLRQFGLQGLDAFFDIGSAMELLG